MKNKKSHWCPNGCGKQVKYTNWHPKSNDMCELGFWCNKCGKKIKRGKIKNGRI